MINGSRALVTWIIVAVVLFIATLAAGAQSCRITERRRRET